MVAPLGLGQLVGVQNLIKRVQTNDEYLLLVMIVELLQLLDDLPADTRLARRDATRDSDEERIFFLGKHSEITIFLAFLDLNLLRFVNYFYSMEIFFSIKNKIKEKD